VGQVTVFTNTTSGNAPITYLWSLGDGSPISTATNPTHAYAQLGVYTVVLTATNAWAKSVCSGQVSIEGKPIVGFISNSPVFVGQPVIFTDTTLANPPVQDWVWNFGDGQVSMAQTPPPHDYASADDYAVILTAINAKGISIYAATVTVRPRTVYLPIVIKP
jgi:PKD repeat protein